MVDEVTARPSVARRLPVWAFVAVVVVYLLILQGLSLVLTVGMDTKYASPTTVNELWRSITVPVAVSLVLAVLVVSYLAWWRPALVDDRPVRPWTALIGVIMLAATVLATNYGGLSDRGVGFTVLLLFSALLVGTTEELMFRGIGVTMFRRNGFTETKVALWSSVVFGLAHATNLITEGPSAFVQVLAAAMSGYFFYLLRRRSSGLLLPALTHGLWDFSLISAAVVPGKSYTGPVISILALVVLAFLVLVRHHRIEPVSA